MSRRTRSFNPSSFRIAFVSDLHYKSLLKEEGLKDLVRLLIDQKADVLLLSLIHISARGRDSCSPSARCLWRGH